MYFSETGFWVDPEFAEFWQERGGLMTFGYPISRVFYENGRHRQYFERAIFEHHEDKPYPLNVLPVRLGASITLDERQRGDAPFTYQAGNKPVLDDTLYFPETGHYLSGIFRDYWEENGGIVTFGYPLSEPFQEADIYTGELQEVQYFERARMEYHPEFPDKYQILLGHLGIQALEDHRVPELATTPQQPTITARNAAPIGPTALYPENKVACGFNMSFWSHADQDQQNREHLKLLADSGCTWVRFQFTWDGLQPEADSDVEFYVWPYVHIVNIARERGLKVLINVAHAPDWARPDDPKLPGDPEAFGDFLRELVPYFDGEVEAWQIWNEPNLIDHDGRIIDPAGYLEMVREAAPAIREADPDTRIVSPGMAPNSMMFPDLALDDDWYFETLFGLNGGEAANYFDVIAIHAYGAGNSPDTYWPSNPADNPGWADAPEFYFRHAEEYHRILDGLGLGEKPVWITEMGWPTPNESQDYAYGEWMTEELQAEYLERAFEIVRTEWPWVEMVFVWHLNAAAYAGADSKFAGFSVTDAQANPRPAYLAVQQFVDEGHAEDVR
ncbi:MAG: cellulase family glycosylhydrolase [Thermomicrobiales bacterium]